MKSSFRLQIYIFKHNDNGPPKSLRQLTERFGYHTDSRTGLHIKLPSQVLGPRYTGESGRARCSDAKCLGGPFEGNEIGNEICACVVILIENNTVVVVTSLAGIRIIEVRELLEKTRYPSRQR